MAYYSDGITVHTDDAYHGGRLIGLTTTHTTRTIQVYVAGKLHAAARPYDGLVRFHLSGLSATDLLFFLAVDHDSATTDYWADAFPTAAAYGNRIRFKVPRLGSSYKPGDVMKLYRGDAGDGSADDLVHEEQLFPGGRGCVGYGFSYGDSYGYDGGNGAGYGYGYGYEYGIGVDMLIWDTEPLPPGLYPVAVKIEDEYGNASTAWTDSITLSTYARAATSLAVDSYDSGTDTLVLTFTESEDIT